MAKKSQTAIEFVILIGFLLFFFTVFFLTIRENMSEKIKERQNLLVRDIAIIVQDEINLALEASDGYYREFKIPQNINGKDYDIDIVESMVYVNLQDKHAISLPVANVTGNIAKGSNIIKKENGEIKLNVWKNIKTHVIY